MIQYLVEYTFKNLLIGAIVAFTNGISYSLTFRLSRINVITKTLRQDLPFVG